MKAIEYLRCSTEQLDQLVDISKVTFCSAFENQNNPDDFHCYLIKAFSREQLKAEMSHPDTEFYFVYGDEQLAAYFKLNVGNAQSDLNLQDSMELERIYVLAEHQGSGLGEQILFKVKDLALREHKTMLWLGVWEENKRAIEFYQRQGFHKFGTHPYFIGSDEQTDWLMRFDLTTL